MKLKQIFCKHVWKHTDRFLLEKGLEQGFNSIYGNRFARYLNDYVCLDCDKEKSVENKIIGELVLVEDEELK